MQPTYTVRMQQIGVLGPITLCTGATWPDVCAIIETMLGCESAQVEWISAVRNQTVPGPWDDAQTRPTDQQ